MVYSLCRRLKREAKRKRKADKEQAVIELDPEAYGYAADDNPGIIFLRQSAKFLIAPSLSTDMHTFAGYKMNMVDT